MTNWKITFLSLRCCFDCVTASVMWMKPVKFHSLTSSSVSVCQRRHLTFISRVLTISGADFVRHNQKFLSRIYPAGSRTSSSNYNPQEFWNVGSQLGEWDTTSRRLQVKIKMYIQLHTHTYTLVYIYAYIYSGIWNHIFTSYQMAMLPDVQFWKMVKIISYRKY